MTAVANWLNVSFAGMYSAMFTFVNGMANDFWTFLAKFMDILGYKGLCFIAASLILCCFVKTRKLGVCMLISIAFGGLFTNLILKDAIARPRPYTHAEYEGFWQAVGAIEQSVNSFPSGHTTTAAATAMGFLLAGNKKWSWALIPLALFMGFTRIYLIAHYTSDVLGGLIVGAVSGTIAFFATKGIYILLEKYKENKLCNFILNKDAWAIFKKKEKADGEN